MIDPKHVPVIVAVGEHVDRPAGPADALEPVALMKLALRACEQDAGAALLDRVNLISLVGLVSWPYRDPVALLCEQLGIDPAERVNTRSADFREGPLAFAQKRAPQWKGR